MVKAAHGAAEEEPPVHYTWNPSKPVGARLHIAPVPARPYSTRVQDPVALGSALSASGDPYTAALCCCKAESSLAASSLAPSRSPSPPRFFSKRAIRCQPQIVVLVSDLRARRAGPTGLEPWR